MISPFEGHNPQIHATAFVHELAFISGKTRVGSDSSIWPMAVLRGDVNTITIGKRSNIQDGAVLHTSHDSDYSRPGGAPLSIGDDVTIGHNAILHGCTIGDRCLIGMGAIVLDGAIIENDSIIGAGALVPPGKVLASGHLWVGSPAVMARPLKAKELEFLVYSAKHYIAIAKRTAATSGC